MRLRVTMRTLYTSCLRNYPLPPETAARLLRIVLQKTRQEALSQNTPEIVRKDKDEP